MLLPTQATAGLVATNTMRSMLDSIEEQRKKDQEQQTGKERDRVTEARISASDEAKRSQGKIVSALFGANKVDATQLKLDMVDRLAAKLGIDTESAKSSYTLGRALEDALKDMTLDEVGKLSDDIGLTDTGVSMTTLLAAIKNPYGDDNQRLTDALTKKANGGKLDTEVQRVVQRLEDVADPKTLEELKLGPQGSDPTRVEDAETKAERQDDIKAAEAGKKLEDVQKIQDVIEKKNDKATEDAGKDGTPEATAEKAADDTQFLAVLAAAADQVGASKASDTTDGTAAADTKSASTASTDTASTDDKSVTSAQVAARSETKNAVNADVVEAAAIEQTPESTSEILPVRIDDIGIYELLKKKLAA